MKNLKSNLTRLKNKINEKLPEGNDVLGFSGVSKAIIVTEIDRIHDIASSIEKSNDESNFDIISLKRVSSELNYKLNELIDAGFDEKNKDKFNSFLNLLSSLSDKTILAYSVTNKNGIRSDQELIVLKEKIDSLQDKLKELSELQTQFATYCSGLSAKKEEIEANSTKAAELFTSIQKMSADLTSQAEDVAKLVTSTRRRHDSIKGISEDLPTLKGNIDTLHATSTETHGKMVAASKEATSAHKQYLENKEKSDKLLEEVSKTLAGATRVSLAKSFKDRKTELTRTQGLWSMSFILSIIALTGLLFYTSKTFPLDISNAISYLNLIPKILITLPFVWFTWFSSRQYSILDKIKEDYAFKYALSMAYDGYKKAVEESPEGENSQLSINLLASILETLSHNPRALYNDKAMPTTPVESLLQGVNMKASVNERGINLESQKSGSGKEEAGKNEQ